MSDDDDEAALEISTNLAMKLLFEEKSFTGVLENNIARRLERLKSAENNATPGFEAVKNAILEFCNVLKSVNKSFVLNADLSLVNIDPEYVNKDAGLIFEAGMKVERICILELNEHGTEVGQQIGSASRRVTQALKLLESKASNGNRIHISSMYRMAARICDFSYTIAQQTERYSNGVLQRVEKRQINNIVERLLKEVDAFNVTVVEKLEEAVGRMKAAKGSKDQTSKFSSSVQNAMRPKLDLIKMSHRRMHNAGSIAPTILAQDKGFLLKDALAKARMRNAALKSSQIRLQQGNNVRKSDPPKSSRQQNSDDDAKRQASLFARELMDQVRNTMNIEDDEKIWCGV